MFGYGADDSHTIEAYLQQSIDDNSLDISVQNYGMFCWGIGDNSYKKIYDLPVKPGDIVITNIIGEPKFFESPNLNLTELFQRPHSYGDNLFIDTLLHYNENGNKIIADKIYKYLDSHNFFEEYSSMTKEVIKPPQFGIKCDAQLIVGDAKKNFRDESIKMYPELESYMEKLSGLRPRIGSIVMNCNPFTLGHRYLIETASKQCAYVFVLVVEEDKSEFRFNDRIELVRSGVKDLVNVKVIPSGNFVISSITFEDYFGKAKLQDKKIDTACDVKMFAEFIAPSLGITARFAGEEPFDKITAQYNETMKRILPAYGIEFFEIPRCEKEGNKISASLVRKLLEKGEYEKIAELVPKSTLDFLEHNYR